RDFHVTGVQTCALPILGLLVAKKQDATFSDWKARSSAACSKASPSDIGPGQMEKTAVKPASKNSCGAGSTLPAMQTTGTPARFEIGRAACREGGSVAGE